MKKTTQVLSFIGLLIFVLLTQHGQAQTTTSDHDRSIDFQQYKTFAWLAPGDSVLNRRRVNKVFGGLIMYSASQELQKRGMAIDTLQPSAIFMFHTEVKTEVKYSQSPTLSIGVGVAGPGYYVGGSAPVAGGNITASEYENGRLSYEMYDAKTGNLIWTGTATKSFKQTDDIEKLIQTSTQRIFKKFPLKPKKKK